MKEAPHYHSVEKAVYFLSSQCKLKTSIRRQPTHDKWSLVLQAVIMALGVIRDENDYSPAEIADFLVELLEQNDNSVNAVEDDGFLAVLLRACGSLSVGSQQVAYSLSKLCTSSRYPL